MIDIDLDLEGLFGSGEYDYQDYEEDFAMEFNNDLLETYGDGGYDNIEDLNNDDPTDFANERGEVLVRTNDGSDEVYIIKDKNIELFSKVIAYRVINDYSSLKNSKINTLIGLTLGFNINDALEAYGFGAFGGVDDLSVRFYMGFDLGYDPENASQSGNLLGIGEGGGVFFQGKYSGIRFRKEGKINPFAPKLKDIIPRIIIQ